MSEFPKDELINCRNQLLITAYDDERQAIHLADQLDKPLEELKICMAAAISLVEDEAVKPMSADPLKLRLTEEGIRLARTAKIFLT